MAPDPASRPPFECAAVLLERFAGRRDAYALQQPGGYIAVRRPLTLDLLRRHVAGSLTIAAYPLTAEGLTPVGVLDFDDRSAATRDRLLWLRRWLKHYEIELLLEPSGNKGYHGWMVAMGLVKANKMTSLLKLALAQAEDALGVGPMVEVFPKQARAADLGNAIKLPWGIHRKTGRRTTFVDEDFRPLPGWGLPAVGALPALDDANLEAVLEEFPRSQEKAATAAIAGAPNRYGLPCFGAMLQGVEEGFRHVASFNLALMLRRQGFDADMAAIVLARWDSERNKSPLGEKHLLRNLSDAYSGTYSMGCGDIERAGHCAVDCPIRLRRGRPRSSLQVEL
ncbi:MAG: hypothetical protein Q7R39_00940 [Dehalococcoidia bacterium]|nr:hypothetical protein [Dehalococcoidia bacterium]